jgi:hypothetical protein
VRDGKRSVVLGQLSAFSLQTKKNNAGLLSGAILKLKYYSSYVVINLQNISCIIFTPWAKTTITVPIAAAIRACFAVSIFLGSPRDVSHMMPAKIKARITNAPATAVTVSVILVNIAVSLAFPVPPPHVCAYTLSDIVEKIANRIKKDIFLLIFYLKMLPNMLMAEKARMIITVPAADVSRAVLAEVSFSGAPPAVRNLTPVIIQRMTTTPAAIVQTVSTIFSIMLVTRGGTAAYVKIGNAKVANEIKNNVFLSTPLEACLYIAY